jgi:hypothetical protein
MRPKIGAKEKNMSTGTRTLEVRIFAVVGKRPSRLARLVAFFRSLMSRAATQPKDQSYADYLETMAILTGF